MIRTHFIPKKKKTLLEEWRCVGRKNNISLRHWKCNFKAKNGMSTVFHLMPSCILFHPKMPFFEINV